MSWYLVVWLFDGIDIWLDLMMFVGCYIMFWYFGGVGLVEVGLIFSKFFSMDIDFGEGEIGGVFFFFDRYVWRV